jgi:1-acyl-sn-glycerol-3-phosphate acyltransferase
MKKTRNDKVTDVILSIVRPPVTLFFKSKYKIEYVYDHIDTIKRKESALVVANHVTDDDPFLVNMFIDRPIRYVSSTVVMLRPVLGFLLTKVAKATPKRKGKADLQTVRDMIKNVRKGYLVGVFPEGNTSYYGESQEMVFSTAKLAKQLKIDVIACKIEGGYLSNNRWMKSSAKNGNIRLSYKTILKKEELKDLTPEEIYDVMKEALYTNAYEENLPSNQRKKRAEGVEHFIYACPLCDSIASITGRGNDLVCDSCGVIGSINEDERLVGLGFDTFLEYQSFQESKLAGIRASYFMKKANLHKVNLEAHEKKALGEFVFKYQSDAFYLTNESSAYIFDITGIKNPITTMKTEFIFDYENETFIIDITNPLLLLDLVKHGGNVNE